MANDVVCVALIGAQRSGKTTMILLLEALNAGVDIESRLFYFAYEAATDLIRQYGPDIVRDPKFQDMLFEEQTRREGAARDLAEQYGGSWIADRTIIDNIAFILYLRQLNPLGSDNPERDFPIRDEWLDYIRDHPFDLVYLCDPDDIELTEGMNVAWTADSIDAERAIRAAVHQCYIEALEMLGVKYELLSGTPEERLQIIRRDITEINIEREGVTVSAEGVPTQAEID